MCPAAGFLEYQASSEFGVLDLVFLLLFAGQNEVIRWVTEQCISMHVVRMSYLCKFDVTLIICVDCVVMAEGVLCPCTEVGSPRAQCVFKSSHYISWTQRVSPQFPWASSRM